MNHQKRMEKAKEIFDRALEIQDIKGTAYAGEKDGLWNFKQTSQRTGVPPATVWSVFFQKHVLAIENAIRANPTDPEEKSEGMDGRILDAINYLVLLYLLLHEDDEAPTADDAAENIRAFSSKLKERGY